MIHGPIWSAPSPSHFSGPYPKPRVGDDAEKTNTKRENEMNTESIIESRSVERVGTITLARVVDFEAVAAAAPDGKISVEDLKNAGDFVVRIQPNGRGAEQVTVPVESSEAGVSFLNGFECAVALKKKGPRKEKKAVDPSERKAAAERAKAKKAAAKPKK